jgi:MFS family permease
VAAASLIGVIGVASIAGRLALGAIAGAGRLLAVFQGCYGVMAISFVVWWVAGSSYAAMALFAVLLGIGYGGFVALAPAVVAARFGVTNLGALLGLLYTGAGLGSAVGPPAAGAVIDAAGYAPAIVASLVVGLISFAIVLRVSARPAVVP